MKWVDGCLIIPPSTRICHWLYCGVPQSKQPRFSLFLSPTQEQQHQTTTTTMSDNKTMPPTQSKSGIPTNIVQCTNLQEMAQKLFYLPGWLKKLRTLSASSSKNFAYTYATILRVQKVYGHVISHHVKLLHTHTQ